MIRLKWGSYLSDCPVRFRLFPASDGEAGLAPKNDCNTPHRMVKGVRRSHSMPMTEPAPGTPEEAIADVGKTMMVPVGARPRLLSSDVIGSPSS